MSCATKNAEMKKQIQSLAQALTILIAEVKSLRSDCEANVSASDSEKDLQKYREMRDKLRLEARSDDDLLMINALETKIGEILLKRNK